MVSRMSREKSTTPLEQDQGSDQTNYTSIQARAVRTRHPRPRGNPGRHAGKLGCNSVWTRSARRLANSITVN